jgi:hypothetical protein
MPTSGTTPWRVGVLVARSARARLAAELCPSMFTAVLNSRKLFPAQTVSCHQHELHQ